MPVYKDNNRNTWYCKFYYTDFDGNQKQKCKRGFARKSDAQAYEREFLLNMADSPTITFKTLYEAYMEWCKPNVKDSTYTLKKLVLEKHVIPVFGEKPINEITSLDISKWRTQVKEQGFSDAYTRALYIHFKAVLAFAVKYKGLRRNPFIEPIKATKRKKEKITFYTLTEFNDFMQHVSELEYHAIFNLLFYSGMRIGELLALTYDDIDIQNHAVNISKTFRIWKNESTAPKTESSNRTIILPEKIFNELIEYTTHIYDLEPDNELFFMSYRDIAKYKKHICSSHKLKEIRLHDFRHSHVSLLIDQGVSDMLIADRIGDSIDVVQKTYAHLYPNKNKIVADKLNALVSQ